MKRRALPPAIAAQVAAHDAKRAADQGPREMVLPYPPSVNKYWRHVVIGGSARVHISREGKAFKARVESLFEKRPISGPVRFHARVYRPRRIGDLDNVMKSLLDSLNGIAFHDDAQIVELSLMRFDDKHDPRVIVRVEPVG